MYSIAVDFGGTNVKIALLTGGQLIAQREMPAYSEEGLAARLAAVEQAIRQIVSEHGRDIDAAAGIGIAMPGIVDPVRKRVLSINGKYEDSVSYDFAHWVASRFGLPLVMENDAKAALLGEVTYGAVVGETDVILMIFGTGIGTAALMNGVLVQGRHHQAGCLGGHMATNIKGERCTCGNIGCVEAQASHWAIKEFSKTRPGFSHSALSQSAVLDYRAVIEASQKGDSFAEELLAELIMHWSAGIINMIHAYDPEIVLLSGGLMKAGGELQQRIADTVHRYAWTPWGKVRFAVAARPDASVLLGLSALLSVDSQI